MARKHVINYYYTVQAQYLKMAEMCNAFEKQVKEGKGSLETLESVKETVTKLKENYDRISYIIYLMNIPNKKSKKDKYIKQTKAINEYLEDSSLDKIVDENKDILEKLKELIKEK